MDSSSKKHIQLGIIYTSREHSRCAIFLLHIEIYQISIKRRLTFRKRHFDKRIRATYTKHVSSRTSLCQNLYIHYEHTDSVCKVR